MTSPLFTIPIAQTSGSIVCTNAGAASDNIYLLTFASPKDNRLTPSLIDALLLALDIIEHRFPRGVVITTSGIEKFYSNGLDLQLALSTEGFWEKWLWKLFRRFITYPMPTVSLLNGHAFAGGFMLGMYHDYRIQNPKRGFLCVNEVEFGAPMHAPMVTVFREKLPAFTVRDMILEAKRFTGPEALQRGIVDGLGGLDETVAFIKDRGLQKKAASGVYANLREEMYPRLLDVLNNHAGNGQWRQNLENSKEKAAEESQKNVENWEGKKAAKL